MENKEVKGILIAIYDPNNKWIGNILVNEDLEIINGLKYGYTIGDHK